MLGLGFFLLFSAAHQQTELVLSSQARKRLLPAQFSHLGFELVLVYAKLLRFGINASFTLLVNTLLLKQCLLVQCLKLSKLRLFLANRVRKLDCFVVVIEDFELPIDYLILPIESKSE